MVPRLHPSSPESAAFHQGRREKECYAQSSGRQQQLSLVESATEQIKVAASGHLGQE